MNPTNQRPGHVRPAHVVVAVPARDEAAHVGACVDSVLAALAYARENGFAEATRVEVVAHRCHDDTVEVASEALRGQPGVARVDNTSTRVGEVRDLAARSALAEVPAAPENVWLLSTDADSVVPRTWVTSMLATAFSGGGSAVVGLAELDGWLGTESGLWAYQALIASKVRRGSHRPFDHHGHVYGANLAVRAAAYLAVGGFPHVAHGEDQALIDALEADGFRVLRTALIAVTTSGRVRGRARNGLADLLLGLQSSPVRPG